MTAEDKRARVFNASRATVLAERAEVASSFWRRTLGLMGRTDWGKTDGLILVPCSSIHCFFMKLIIDVVFVGPDGVVERVASSLRPWSLGPIVPSARYVLELPCGNVARTGTEEGDRIVFELATSDRRTLAT